MDGDIDEMIDSLITADQAEKMKAMGGSSEF
jgi:protein subunit release factor A